MNQTLFKENSFFYYLDRIRNSFNCNNYVFEVRSMLHKEGNEIDKIRYVSEVGFQQYQNERKGMLLHSGTINVQGIERFLIEVALTYKKTGADSISTELYDRIGDSNKLTIEFPKQ